MAKKRANGEGSIRKRSDGRWEGRYTAGYHPETGKRIIKNVLGKTQAECKAKLSAALESVKGIDVSRADEYTVATWLRSWYDIYAKPNVRVATADHSKGSVAASSSVLNLLLTYAWKIAIQCAAYSSSVSSLKTGSILNAIVRIPT